jgi:N utilization substance protein B
VPKVGIEVTNQHHDANRKQVRESAFQSFYAQIFAQATTASSDATLQDLMLQLKTLEMYFTQDLQGLGHDFVKELHKAAYVNRDKINELLTPLLKGWKLTRMAKIDYTLLTLGTAELLFLTPPTPRAVVCNEYVELAKKFGHQDSASFVNAVLDNVSKLAHE